MSSLTDLLVSEVERCQQERDAVLAKNEEHKTEVEKQTLAAFNQYIERWTPFRETLGLKREPTINHDLLRVEWRGTSKVNNLPISTFVTMPFRSNYDQVTPMLKIEIRLTDDERVYSATVIEHNSAAAEYPRRLGRMCSVLMERYATQQADDRALTERRTAALAEARGYIEIAKTYGERYSRVKNRARRWAEEWSEKLWEPHTLWRVRYVAVGSNVETEETVDNIVVMESPDDIVNALREFPTATVTQVLNGGKIKELEIPSFLAAEMISISVHEIDAPMPFHRHHNCFGCFVNVPAHILDTPAAAPSIIPWFRYVEECNAAPQLGQIDFAHVAELTPEVFIEEYHWWQV